MLFVSARNSILGPTIANIEHFAASASARQSSNLETYLTAFGQHRTEKWLQQNEFGKHCDSDFTQLVSPRSHLHRSKSVQFKCSEFGPTIGSCDGLMQGDATVGPLPGRAVSFVSILGLSTELEKSVVIRMHLESKPQPFIWTTQTFTYQCMIN